MYDYILNVFQVVSVKPAISVAMRPIHSQSEKSSVSKRLEMTMMNISACRKMTMMNISECRKYVIHT